MPTSIGLSMPPHLESLLATAGGQPSLTTHGVLPGQQQHQTMASSSLPHQVSASRSLNTLHQLLTNGAPPAVSSATSPGFVNTNTSTTPTMTNVGRWPLPGLHGNHQNGHGLTNGNTSSATLIPSVRNPAVGTSLNFAAGTPHIPLSSVPNVYSQQGTPSPHVSGGGTQPPSFTSKDFAIPRADIFPSVPRSDVANNTSNLPNSSQNGHLYTGIPSPNDGTIPQHHQNNGIQAPFSNVHPGTQAPFSHLHHPVSSTSAPPMSSAPSRNIPTVEVTPSAAPFSGVPNVSTSAGLAGGVDTPDYNGQILPHSGPASSLDPPQNLTVSKVIGRHGILLTWKPPIMDEMGRNHGNEIVGYKIYVDGKQKQFVTNAHLTKVSLVYSQMLKKCTAKKCCTQRCQFSVLKRNSVILPVLIYTFSGQFEQNCMIF